MLATQIRKNPTEIQASNIWCPLIWKSLFIAGYDIPPDYFSDTILPLHEDSIIEFNQLCDNLSQLNGWPIYALYCLLNFDITQSNHANMPSDIYEYKPKHYKLIEYFTIASQHEKFKNDVKFFKL
jgi:hypothetical protein